MAIGAGIERRHYTAIVGGSGARATSLARSAKERAWLIRVILVLMAVFVVLMAIRVLRGVSRR
jgi:hypothetical protein